MNNTNQQTPDIFVNWRGICLHKVDDEHFCERASMLEGWFNQAIHPDGAWEFNVHARERVEKLVHEYFGIRIGRDRVCLTLTAREERNFGKLMVAERTVIYHNDEAQLIFHPDVKVLEGEVNTKMLTGIHEGVPSIQFSQGCKLRVCNIPAYLKPYVEHHLKGEFDMEWGADTHSPRDAIRLMNPDKPETRIYELYDALQKVFDQHNVPAAYYAIIFDKQGKLRSSCASVNRLIVDDYRGETGSRTRWDDEERYAVDENGDMHSIADEYS